MMGRSHLVISTGVTLSILGLADETIALPIAAVTAVSALLPDIDEPNSLLVSRAIPTGLIRLLQLGIVGIGVFIYFYGQTFAPWNTMLAVLVTLVSFMPTRFLRNVAMILIGVGLIIFGQQWVPWNVVIGSLLIICALLPHRGLTHTLYGVIGWTGLLYFASNGSGHTLWLAGGLSYLLHLLADAATNRGIRPLPPFAWRLRLNLMSTGTRLGSIVEGGFVLLTFMLVYFVFIYHMNI